MRSLGAPAPRVVVAIGVSLTTKPCRPAEHLYTGPEWGEKDERDRVAVTGGQQLRRVAYVVEPTTMFDEMGWGAEKLGIPG